MMLNDEGWSLLLIIVCLLALLGAGFARMGRERSMEARLRSPGGAADAAVGLALRFCGVTLLAVLPAELYQGGLGRLGMALSLGVGAAVLLCVLMPRLRRKAPDALTLPELYTDEKWSRAACAVLCVLSALALAAGAVSLLARIFASVFSLHYTIALAAAAALSILLALLCGPGARLGMDRVQAALMVFGLAGLAVTAARWGAEGESTLTALLPQAAQMLTGGTPGWTDIASDLLWGLGAMGLVALMQRCIAVRSRRAAHWGRIAGAVLIGVLIPACAALGLLGRAVDGDLVGDLAAETVLLQMAANPALPEPLTAALIAALVTTLLMAVQALLRTVGDYVAWDIVSPIFSLLNERPLLRAADASAAVAGLAAFLLGLSAGVRLYSFALAGLLFASVLAVALIARAAGFAQEVRAWPALCAGTLVAAVWLCVPATRALGMLGALPCALAVLFTLFMPHMRVRRPAPIEAEQDPPAEQLPPEQAAEEAEHESINL